MSVSYLTAGQGRGSYPPKQKGAEMMTIKAYLKQMTAVALLPLLSSACAAQAGSNAAAPPTVIAEQSAFSDPSTCCAAMDTTDAPDARYVGVSAREGIIRDLRGKAGISEEAPADSVAAGTVWRRADGKVWASLVGANPPCSEKADASTTAKPQMADSRCASLNAETIPVAVAGRATIPEWRCVDGDPQEVTQIVGTYSEG